MPLQHAPSIELPDNRAPSGFAGVLRTFRGLNRSSSSQPITPAPSIGPVSSTTSTSQPEYFGGPPNREQLFAQLRHGQPLEIRTAAAEEFRGVINEYSLSSVMEIWYTAEDLLNPEYPDDTRRAAFKLLSTCIKHSDKSSLDRLHFFRIIAGHPVTSDFDEQLQALIALTGDGRDLNSFERQIAQLLSDWLRLWFKDATRARQARKRDGMKASDAAVAAGEFNLKQVFQYMTQVVRFNFMHLEEKEVDTLLRDVIQICKRTTAKDDIRCALIFFEAMITYGYVPKTRLVALMEVLCGAYATIRDLADQTWNVVRNLCKSYVSHSTVLILRDILEGPTKKDNRNTNALRGAVYFIERFLLADEAEGLPHVEFSMVMSCFKSGLQANSGRLELDICRAISNILSNPNLIAQITFDEWAIPLEIMAYCSRRTTERADGTPLYPPMPKDPTIKTSSRDRDGIAATLSTLLFEVINQLEKLCQSPDFIYSDVVINFFVQVHRHIPDSCAELIVQHYNNQCLLYPSCSNWLENCKTLLDIIFHNRYRPAHLRLNLLSSFKQLFETIRGITDDNDLRTLIDITFENFQHEREPTVMEALIRIAIDLCVTGSDVIFTEVLHILTALIEKESAAASEERQPRPLPSSRPSSLAQSAHFGMSPVSMVTRGLVRIFIRVVNRSAFRAVKVWEELVGLAGSSHDTEARLIAMRLLFRIRSDADHAIYLIKSPDVDTVAEVLGRAGKSLDETSPVHPPHDDSASSRSNRSNSLSQSSFLFRNSSRTAVERPEKLRPKHAVLWTYPEARPHPEAIPEQPSTVLFCYTEDTHAVEGETKKEEESETDKESESDLEEKLTQVSTVHRLRMSLWLEQLIPILQKGCDWEIYSYVLIHTASQLSNRTLFSNCRAHILHLRGVVCDQLHTNRIPNADLPAEVKRADIAVAVIGILTVLVGYHEWFARNESEAIVKAFQLGLHSWQRTAKPCIHALTVCCYELPMSTSKFLSGILTKLSQIITTAAVSVHILEFLLVLARLPNLYVNFTEPDFRNVFGIAFRYIQHTKESTNSHPSRTSYPSRTLQKEILIEQVMQHEQPELPQYVLTMAYNVLTTWFLSLRIPERPKYVPWIIRGLVLGSEGVDEQSQACIDMLQRFTYSDVELAPPQGIQSLESRGQVVTKSWLMASASILTVSTETVSGVTHLVVRKPTGTSYFSLKVEKPMPTRLHPLLDGMWHYGEELAEPLDREALESYQQQLVMPSHLILQLAAGAGTPEGGRPILLPDNEQTKRALDVFDRIPVVDFHKIGVVYVAPDQEKEVDILANVMGPPDYTDFVDGLGKLIKLKGSKINTGGLDREMDLDGTHTYFWADKTTEIVFHITTMMPTNLEHDPVCTAKKRHIGNDFVNIIFNNSGKPYAFDTIPAQFAFYNILITPEAKLSSTFSSAPQQDSSKVFYKVELQSKPGLPSISPASEPKIVSGRSLSSFVRNIGLNASILAHVFNEGGREYVSSWRHRLRQINLLRERVKNSTPATSPPITGVPPQTAGGVASRRVSAATVVSEGGSLRSATTIANGEWPVDETEQCLESVDFSRWT